MESDIFYSECCIRNSGKGKEEEKKILAGRKGVDFVVVMMLKNRQN